MAPRKSRWSQADYEVIRPFAKQVRLGVYTMKQAAEILHRNYFPSRTLSAIRAQLFVVVYAFDDSARSDYYASKTTRRIIAAASQA